MSPGSTRKRFRFVVDGLWTQVLGRGIKLLVTEFNQTLCIATNSIFRASILFFLTRITVSTDSTRIASY